MVELLVVCLILAILAAIAVPAYLQFRDNAYKKAASSDAQEVLVSAVSYGEDNYPGSSRDPDRASSTSDNGYQGMTIAELKATYDSGISRSAYVNNSGTEATGVTTRAALDATHFCVYATAGRWFVYQLNPTGQLLATTSASAVCT